MPVELAQEKVVLTTPGRDTSVCVYLHGKNFKTRYLIYKHYRYISTGISIYRMQPPFFEQKDTSIADLTKISMTHFSTHESIEKGFSDNKSVCTKLLIRTNFDSMTHR
jgi:hypothetical protein